MTRKFTRKILEMVEDGIINEEILIKDLLNYLSEAEVEDFAFTNGYIEEEEDEEEEDEPLDEHLHPNDEARYGDGDKNADRVDGYDRDDLGESPDY